MSANAKQLPICDDNPNADSDERALDESVNAALRGEYLSVLQEPIPPRLNALVQRIRMIESAARG